MWDVKNAKTVQDIPPTPWFAITLEAKIGDAVLSILPGVIKGKINLLKQDIEEPRDPKQKAIMMKGSVIFWHAIQEQKRDEKEALHALYQEILHVHIQGNPPSLKNSREFDKKWIEKIQEAARAGQRQDNWP